MLVYLCARKPVVYILLCPVGVVWGNLKTPSSSCILRNRIIRYLFRRGLGLLSSQPDNCLGQHSSQVLELSSGSNYPGLNPDSTTFYCGTLGKSLNNLWFIK